MRIARTNMVRNIRLSGIGYRVAMLRPRASQASIFNQLDHVEQCSYPELPGLTLARLYIKQVIRPTHK
jgi:hypothetical protein